MSRTSRVQSSFFSALPSSEMASGPGNISGNSVKTVADQVISYSVMPTLMYRARIAKIGFGDCMFCRLFHIAVLAGFDVFGHRDDDAALVDFDYGNGFARE